MLNSKILATTASAIMLLALSAQAQGADVRPEAAGVIDLAARNTPDVLMERGEYWLGVMVSRATPAMQAQLKLPKDQGLLVESVQPESPAAKAGIRPFDLLLKANDTPLNDLHDLMKLINKVKEGKLTLELLRSGKHETVAATLAKRPADELDKGLSPEARAWIDKLGPKMSEGQPLRFHVFRPGQIVPPGGPVTAAAGLASANVEVTVHTKASLTDGSQIEITRKDDSPAKVVVTRDKQRWEGTSDDVSKIPEGVRAEVERLLHSPVDHIRLFTSPAAPAPGNVIYFGGPAGPPSTITLGGPSLEKRLGEMQKQIDELRRQVKALQGDKK
jgi:hypothetical protein